MYVIKGIFKLVRNFEILLIQRSWYTYVLFGNNYANLTLEDLKVLDFKNLNPYLEGDQFIHPDCNKNNLTRDDALIRLKSTINASTLGQNASENSKLLARDEQGSG